MEASRQDDAPLKPRRPSHAAAWWPAAAVCGAVMVACSGPEAWTDPAGPGAEPGARVTTLLFATGAAVYVIVMLLAVVGIMRARRTDRTRPTGERADPAAARRLVVVVGLVGPALVLAGLNVFTVRAGIATAPDPDEHLLVDVVAEQFWWRVDYPQLDVVTANEIHIPVGRPVTVRITSTDVIHSFWIPRLGGKVDATPGHVTAVVLEADEAGRYSGRCTEYCGLAHAQMRVHVVAQDPADFDAWAAAQGSPRPEPDDRQAAGRATFAASCIRCHDIRGHTDGAGGDLGPDLTHLVSRETIAAGILPNTPQELAAFIRDPHVAKPGARMPPTQLADEELDALVDYLLSVR